MNNYTIPTTSISYLSPENSGLVLIPEVIYSISINKTIGVQLMNHFRSLLMDQNDSNFPKLVDNKETSQFSNESLQSIEKLKGILMTHKDSAPWLILGILSNYEGKVMSITRILSISNDRNNDESFILTLKVLARGKILNEFSKDKSFQSLKVNICTNESISYEGNLTNHIKSFQSVLSEFFQQVDWLIESYSIGLKNNSIFHTFLRLSPLASIIFLNLKNDDSINKINKVYSDLNYENEKIINNISIIYDLVISCLPISGSFKYDQLKELDIDKRLTFSHDLIRDFNELIKSFKKNYDLYMKDFIYLDDSNKAKLFLNHIQSLKKIADTFRRNGQVIVTRKNQLNNHAKTAKRRNINNNDDDEDDDESMRKLKSFYKELSKPDSKIKISFDGNRILKKDFERLFKMSKNQMMKNSSEFQVLSNYLEIVIDLPWSSDELTNIDLTKAEKQLNDDHYGIFSVKNRLLEYLGVLNLEKKNQKSFSKAPILCLSGPPGVGKTSLAQSIAKTLDRKFQRLSLGGINDEAEIRGHRRTYVGSMPGMIVSALRKAKTLNPVILLDEIDKLNGNNSNSRGDPQAAMLEVLDPEQNSNFIDHYLGFPIDLSQILFICTANDMRNLHPALRDRLEIIYLNGYSFMDKLEIVKKYLLPKELIKNSLAKESILFENDQVILQMILNYTNNESGIRNLQREIAKLCRKKALEINFEKKLNPIITNDNLPSYLGIPNSYYSIITKQSKLNSKFSKNYGLVNGLSYNSNGSGSLLLFELINIINETKTPKFIMTGRLGEVLTESVQIASSYVKNLLIKNSLEFSNSSLTSKDALNTLLTNEIHLHAPEGGISKDGPSAGIAITLGLLSLVYQTPVPNNIAMTGEMTLRGMILPIGGVKEKLLGAHLSKSVDVVIIPRINRIDIIQYFIDNLKVNDKFKINEILLKILKNDNKLLNSLEIFEEPEVYVKEKLGIKIYYVEEFCDVIKVAWGKQVKLVENDQLNELPLTRL